MNIQIHIQNVQSLHIGATSECFPPASASPAAPVVGRISQIGQAVGRPPFEALRAKLRGVCATCGGRGEIMRGLPDFPGEFETAACPVCRGQRAE